MERDRLAQIHIRRQGSRMAPGCLGWRAGVPGRGSSSAWARLALNDGARAIVDGVRALGGGVQVIGDG